MATLTLNNDTPSRGAAGRMVRSGDVRGLKIATGVFTFDNSYPTGGEDISDIWGVMPNGVVVFMVMDDPDLSAGTGKKVIIDYTNKKAMLVTNAATPAEVANASDQSGAASLRWVALGY